MRNFYHVVSAIILLLLFAGCEFEAELSEVSEASQDVYFQFEYINHAWGYQHYGWLVDSSGNVKCYNKPEKWIHADSLHQIRGGEMAGNLLEADSVCYVIDKEVLKSKINLINAASKGRISEPVHEMYDAGGYIYSAYVYNKQEKVYKKILLKQLGDFRIDNQAPEAIKLYKWLESINYSIQANK